jgi:hypothetical protein
MVEKDGINVCYGLSGAFVVDTGVFIPFFHDYYFQILSVSWPNTGIIEGKSHFGAFATEPGPAGLLEDEPLGSRRRKPGLDPLAGGASRSSGRPGPLGSFCGEGEGVSSILTPPSLAGQAPEAAGRRPVRAAARPVVGAWPTQGRGRGPLGGLPASDQGVAALGWPRAPRARSGPLGPGRGSLDPPGRLFQLPSASKRPLAPGLSAGG